MTVSTVSIFRREQYKQIAILKVFVLTEYIINSIKSSINSMNTEHFTVTEQYYQYSSGNPEDLFISQHSYYCKSNRLYQSKALLCYLIRR